MKKFTLDPKVKSNAIERMKTLAELQADVDNALERELLKAAKAYELAKRKELGLPIPE